MRTLFRQLLLWGLSMCVVSAVLCQLLAGVMARAWEPAAPAEDSTTPLT